MIVLCDEELRMQPQKRCKDLTAALRDTITSSRKCRGRRVSLSIQEDDNDNNDYDEHQIVVSEIRSQAMEKLRQKRKIACCSTRKQEDDEEDNAGSEFHSVGSCLSECSSVVSKEEYFSVKTGLSRCSSLKEMEVDENPWKIYLREYSRKRSVIQELCHCEGWPFGLGRKAVLLPPLPKSPSESWSWIQAH